MTIEIYGPGFVSKYTELYIASEFHLVKKEQS